MNPTLSNGPFVFFADVLLNLQFRFPFKSTTMTSPHANVQLEQQDVQLKGNFTSSEVTAVHSTLLAFHHCYFKDLLLKVLSGDKQGVIKDWSDSVTKPSLKLLIGLWEEMGFSSFPSSMVDEREKELCSKGKNVEGIISEGEALLDIKCSAIHAMQCITGFYGLALNERVRETLKKVDQLVCNHFPQVIKAIQNTDMFYPSPFVKQATLIGPNLSISTRR